VAPSRELALDMNRSVLADGEPDAGGAGALDAVRRLSGRAAVTFGSDDTGASTVNDGDEQYARSRRLLELFDGRTVDSAIDGVASPSRDARPGVHPAALRAAAGRRHRAGRRPGRLRRRESGLRPLPTRRCTTRTARSRRPWASRTPGRRRRAIAGLGRRPRHPPCRTSLAGRSPPPAGYCASATARSD
jgi:hypothetical protein